MSRETMHLGSWISMKPKPEACTKWNASDNPCALWPSCSANSQLTFHAPSPTPDIHTTKLLKSHHPQLNVAEHACLGCCNAPCSKTRGCSKTLGWILFWRTGTNWSLKTSPKVGSVWTSQVNRSQNLMITITISLHHAVIMESLFGLSLNHGSIGQWRKLKRQLLQ